MDILENVPLNGYTTFKLGGVSRFFVDVESVEELIDAIQFARSHGVSYFVLGGGSNVLIRDEGFPGLTIRIAIKGKKITPENDSASITVSAGEQWDDVVALAVEHDLYGIENLSGIPGTVGAAPIQNIGAYGMEVKDVITTVEVLDTQTMNIRTLENKECAFNYRDSIFKHTKGKQLIVVSVTFMLKKNGSLCTDYNDLKQYFKERHNLTPSLKTVRQAVLEIRKSKFPDLKVVGTAGSFFKNPIVSCEEYNALKSKYPDIPCYTLEGGAVKIPLAWILEHICNIKGVRSGNVGTFETQPLVLVHYGGGSAKEIQQFAKHIQQQVKEKTNIKIIPEVTLI